MVVAAGTVNACQNRPQMSRCSDVSPFRCLAVQRLTLPRRAKPLFADRNSLLIETATTTSLSARGSVIRPEASWEPQDVHSSGHCENLLGQLLWSETLQLSIR